MKWAQCRGIARGFELLLLGRGDVVDEAVERAFVHALDELPLQVGRQGLAGTMVRTIQQRPRDRRRMDSARMASGLNGVRS